MLAVRKALNVIMDMSHADHDNSGAVGAGRHLERINVKARDAILALDAWGVGDPCCILSPGANATLVGLFCVIEANRS